MGGSIYPGPNSRNSEIILGAEFSRSSNKRMLQIRPNGAQTALAMHDGTNDYLGVTENSVNGAIGVKANL
jgi:hypothetical protein